MAESVNQKFHPAKTAPQIHTTTAHQAVLNSPALGRLAGLVQESRDMLKTVESLIPETLRPLVAAGPLDADSWCLLVTGNAAAAKIRQLVPLIQARLLGKGCKVTSIRLKILIGKKY